MTDTPVIVGEITGLSGVKGWVKVFSHTEPRTNILEYNPWFLKQRGEWKTVKLLNGRPQGKTIVAQLEGVTCREEARELIGTEIAIQPSQLKKLASSDFYWRDLEGLSVVNLDNKVVGSVSHLIETGANDVMVVKLSAEQIEQRKIKEMMIPYLIDSVIKKVDLDEKVIQVDWDDDYI